MQGGNWYRQSIASTTYTGIKRELDAYAVWQMQGLGRLRLSLANALHQDWIGMDVYTAPGMHLVRRKSERGSAILRLQWEAGIAATHCNPII